MGEEEIDAFTYLADLLRRGDDLDTALRRVSKWRSLGQESQSEVWFDNLAPMAQGKTAAGSPAMSAFNTTWQALKFIVDDGVYLYFHINHDIKQGSLVYPHVHWSTGGTSTNTVKWQLDYTIAKGHNQEAFPSTTAITVEQAASGTAWQHMITESTNPFTAPEPDSVVIVKATRITNGGSENADDVFGIYVDLHYLIDRPGTINKSPDFYSNAV